MAWVAWGMALLLALGINVIGAQYLMAPRKAALGFGLPLPEAGVNVAWWLRLKGVRDIVSGLVVLVFMVWGEPWMVGLVVAAEAIIPIGDMLLILSAKGSVRHALLIHGFTALVMILTASLLLAEAR